MTNGTQWLRLEQATMVPTQSGNPPDGSDPWGGTIELTTAGWAATRPGDEQAIVAAVLDGDRNAFRVLVDRELAAVVRACHRVLGDFAEAEDVAQEAFVTAYRSLATWRGEGPFGAWLARIAVRLAIRQAARRKTVAGLAASGEDHDERLQALPAGRGSDPEGPGPARASASDRSATRSPDSTSPIAKSWPSVSSPSDRSTRSPPSPADPSVP